MPYNSQILPFLSSDVRNKIIVHFEAMHKISYFDLGRTLSEKLLPLENDPQVSLKAKTILDELLSSAIVNHPAFGKILAVRNLGILLEHELKIDLIHLFSKYSQNNGLFLLWEGAVEGNNLYFLNKESGLKFSLQNISHIILHEVQKPDKL